MKLNISTLIYDFDGVMTDNTVYVDQDGKETVRVHRGDGLAISYFKQKGYHQLILSTESNPVVSQRAKKLDIPVIQGVTNKKEALTDYCKKQNISLATVCYVGNDLNDCEAMTIVGLKVCPADAAKEIRQISDIITKKIGGSGVIRELISIFNDS